MFGLAFSTEVLILAGVALVAFRLLRIYFKGAGMYYSPIQLYGKCCVVTGANSGLGFETALELAKRHCTLIIGCRNMKKCGETVFVIRQRSGNPNVFGYHLDLADFASVKEFASNVRQRLRSVDILVNNAGVFMIPERTLTKDNCELQMQTNHLGHFLLTFELKSLFDSYTRVVNVSSDAHTFCTQLNVKDLTFEHGYTPWQAYAASKLANVLFTTELIKREHIRSFSVHPGLVMTDLLFSAFAPGTWANRFILLFKPLFPFLLKSALEGAQTIIYASLHLSLGQNNGAYLKDSQVSCASKLGQDTELARSLWEVSERLTNCEWQGKKGK